MATSNMVPLKSANTRVFLIEGRARPDRTASYKSIMRLMGISQGFGDIERIELPSEDQYGNFGRTVCRICLDLPLRHRIFFGNLAGIFGSKGTG